MIVCSGEHNRSAYGTSGPRRRSPNSSAIEGKADIPRHGQLMSAYQHMPCVKIHATPRFPSAFRCPPPRQEHGTSKAVPTRPERVFLPSRYNQDGFYRAPPRSSAHVIAGPARRGRCPDFLLGFTNPQSGRKLGRCYQPANKVPAVTIC